MFFLLVMGVFHNFFWWVVGVKNMCPPPTHTFNSGTAQMFVVDNVHQYMIMIKKLMKQIQVQQV
jgi:hypothetical protein